MASLRPRQVGSLAPSLQRHLEQLERGALDVLVDQALLCGRGLARVSHVGGHVGRHPCGLPGPLVLVLVQDHSQGLRVAQVTLGRRFVLLEVYAVWWRSFFGFVRRAGNFMSNSINNVKQIAASLRQRVVPFEMAPLLEKFGTNQKVKQRFEGGVSILYKKKTVKECVVVEKAS